MRWVSLLMRRNTVKQRFNHLYRGVLLGLFFTLANYLVSFSTPDLPWDPPKHAYATFPKMDSSPEAYGAALAHPITGEPRSCMLHTVAKEIKKTNYYIDIKCSRYIMFISASSFLLGPPWF